MFTIDAMGCDAMQRYFNENTYSHSSNNFRFIGIVNNICYSVACCLLYVPIAISFAVEKGAFRKIFAIELFSDRKTGRLFSLVFF